MPTAQITLTDDESRELESLSELKGKSPDDLLHEAVESLLVRHRREKWLAALTQAQGIWKDRDDLPTLQELRHEWDRR